jgi:hypothetical protein
MQGWSEVALGFFICVTLVSAFWWFIEYKTGDRSDCLTTFFAVLLGIPFTIWAVRSNTQWGWLATIAGGVVIGYFVSILLCYTSLAVTFVIHKILGKDTDY